VIHFSGPAAGLCPIVELLLILSIAGFERRR
jgi:hypothetical protein